MSTISGVTGSSNQAAKGAGDDDKQAEALKKQNNVETGNVEESKDAEKASSKSKKTLNVITHREDFDINLGKDAALFKGRPKLDPPRLKQKDGSSQKDSSKNKESTSQEDTPGSTSSTNVDTSKQVADSGKVDGAGSTQDNNKTEETEETEESESSENHDDSASSNKNKTNKKNSANANKSRLASKSSTKTQSNNKHQVASNREQSKNKNDSSSETHSKTPAAKLQNSSTKSHIPSTQDQNKETSGQQSNQHENQFTTPKQKGQEHFESQHRQADTSNKNEQRNIAMQSKYIENKEEDAKVDSKKLTAKQRLAINKAQAVRSNIVKMRMRADLDVNLVSNYVMSRGSYTAQIMLLNSKLRKDKNKNITFALKTSSLNRRKQSARKHSMINKQEAKLKEAKDLQKTMRWVSLVLAIVAIIAMVCSFGSLGPAAIAIVSVCAAISLTIAIADMFPKKENGQEMNIFQKLIYDALRANGASKKDALKKSGYIMLGIEIGLAVVSIGAGIAGATKEVAKEVAKEVEKEITKNIFKKIADYIKKLFQRLIKAMKKIKPLKSTAKSLEKTISDPKYAVTMMRKLTLFITGAGMIAQGSAELQIAFNKRDAQDIKADIKLVEALFENINFIESLLHEVFKDNMAAFSEIANSVGKCIDAEYDTISAINKRRR